MKPVIQNFSRIANCIFFFLTLLISLTFFQMNLSAAPFTTEPLYLDEKINSKIVAPPFAPVFAIGTDDSLFLLGYSEIEKNATKRESYTADRRKEFDENIAPLLIKIDASGKVIWEKELEKDSLRNIKSFFAPPGVPSIAPLENGGCVISFYESSRTQLLKAKIIAFDSAGNELWRWQDTNKNTKSEYTKEFIAHLKTTQDGDTLFVLYQSPLDEKRPQYLICLDSRGNERGRLELGTTFSDPYFIDTRNGVCVCGIDPVKQTDVKENLSYTLKTGWSADNLNPPEFKNIDKSRIGHIEGLACSLEKPGVLFIHGFTFVGNRFYPHLLFSLNHWIQKISHLDFWTIGQVESVETSIEQIDLSTESLSTLKLISKKIQPEAQEVGEFLSIPRATFISLPEQRIALLEGSKSAQLTIFDTKEEGKILSKHTFKGKGEASGSALFYDSKNNVLHLLGISSSLFTDFDNALRTQNPTIFWMKIPINEIN